MAETRLVILSALILLLAPLAGCIGQDEPPAADSGNSGTPPPAGGDGNGTTPGGDTGNGTTPGGSTPGGSTPAPAPVSEAVTVTVNPPTPPATAGSGSAAGSASVAPGFATCKMTISTGAQTFIGPQQVTITASDAAGTVIATATIHGGSASSPAAPVSADCSGAPTAAGPLTYAGTGTVITGTAIDVLLEVTY